VRCVTLSLRCRCYATFKATTIYIYIWERSFVCVLERFPREIIPRVHSTSAINMSVYAYACVCRIRRRTNARKTRCCYNFCNQTGHESYQRFLFDLKYFSGRNSAWEQRALRRLTTLFNYRKSSYAWNCELSSHNYEEIG